MANFNSPEGDIAQIYLSDTEILERYVGNQLWLWGASNHGKLGTNSSLVHRSSPVQTVAGGTNWKQVDAGTNLMAGIKTDGTLWTWGNNAYGGLGNNQSGISVNRSSPVQTISGGTNWKQVSAGPSHTAAIKTDGTLWIWGYNIDGQLGINTVANKSSPVQTISGGTNWKQVSLAGTMTAAIKTDGTLWTWGYNTTGVLGTNDDIYRSSPVQTVAGGTNWKQVSAASTKIAAIKTDGTLWAWGRNDYGQLGLGDTTYRSSPVQTVAGGTNWKQVSSSASVTAAIKTDGTLWTWGYNGNGALGTNDTASRSSPVQTIAGGTNWKQVSCSDNGGGYFTAAIKTDGTLWTWGYNDYGVLGTNDITDRSSPVQIVARGNNWKQVSTGDTVAAVTYTES